MQKKLIQIRAQFSVGNVLKALCHAIRADCLLMKPDAPTR